MPVTAKCARCLIRHYPKCGVITARWDANPLLDLLGQTEVAKRIGIRDDSIHHARTRGLNDRQADTWAIRCGYHPAQIWTDWFDAGLTAADEVFVEHGWRPAWEFNQHERASA